MNTTHNTLQSAKRLISFTLACTMLFNLTAPAAAQHFSTPSQNTDPLTQYLFNAAQQSRQENQSFNISALTHQYAAPLNDLQIQRLTYIQSVFLPDLNNAQTAPAKTDFEIWSEEFKKEVTSYTAQKEQEIEQAFSQGKRELQHKKEEFLAQGEYTPDSVEAYYTENLNNLNAWKQNARRTLTRWNHNTLANVQRIFTTAPKGQNSPEQEMLTQREAAVKKMVYDLWQYYETGSKMAEHILLRVAPVILPLKTLDNKSFFTPGQQTILRRLYLRTVREASLPKGEDKHPEIRVKLPGFGPNQTSPKEVFTAVAALGMLPPGDNSDIALVNFWNAHSTDEFAAAVLPSVIVALLSLKAYGSIKGIIHTATNKEHNIESMDLLSAVTWVNELANINGHYLGESSKYTQYPLNPNALADDELGARGNAWEDVARLLADDGTPEALNILRQYGVEKCLPSAETNIRMQREVKIQCAAIRPFLAGALASGKSGVNHYAPILKQENPGSYLNGNGSGGTVTAAQAQANRQYNAGVAALFREYVASTGLTADAAIARWMFVQSMGDLNAETELHVDNMLYQVYASNPQHPKPGYAISNYSRGSNAYNAKVARQARVRFFRTAAPWVDLAILLWCVYDITKWLRNGYKITKGLLKASKMARNGATVAERAMMLRKLNVAPQMRALLNIPSRIRGGMEAPVNGLIAQFTTPFKMPKVPGFVESSGTLVAQTAAFSAETGVLATDAAKLVSASGGQLNLQQAWNINSGLRAAAEDANTAFANRSWWQRFFTWDKNASYRSYLASAVENRLGLTGALPAAETTSVTGAIRTAQGITVPENIELFKAPELFKNGTLQMADLTRVLAGTRGITPAAADVDHTAQLLREAQANANLQFAHRGWFSRTWNGLWGKSNQQYKGMLLDNLAASFDADGMLFTNPAQYSFYRSLATTISNDRALAAPSSAVLAPLKELPFKPLKTSYKQMGAAILNSSDASVMPQIIPLNISMDTGISGVEGAGVYQRVLFTDTGKSFLFGVGNNLGKPINPGHFKMMLDANDVPAFIRAADTTPGLANPFEIKLTPTKKGGVFSLFSGKDKLYAHRIPVSIRQADGTLATSQVVFRPHTRLNMADATAVLEQNGTLAFYRNGELFSAPALQYGIPKYGLRSFLDIARQAQQPLNLTVKSGRNKLTPLMWATGLSLSSASSSLIPSLEANYGNAITDTDKTLISLALPYIPSLFSPALTPLVMKFGALRTLKGALAVSTAGLAFTAFNGFYGNIGTKDENGHIVPGSLPPIWPLFVSGTAIGVSAAMSRASLNLLIDGIGGGKSLLQSMMYKNIGTFALLGPQIIVGFSGWKPDFSFAFPVTGALSAGALTWVSSSRIDSNIGKVAGFMKMDRLALDWTLPKTLFKNTGTFLWEGGKETVKSFRLLGVKELALPTLAATAFTGFEASAFNKAGQQLIRPSVEDSGFINGFSNSTDKKNWTSLLTSASVVAFPLLTRLKAKSLLSMLADPARPGIEYQRMLKLSWGANAAGLTLLMTKGWNDDGLTFPGFMGIAAMGIGTANVTQSYQKLANINIVRSPYVLKRTMGMSPEAALAFRKEVGTKAMTSFSISQLGLAGLPLGVSHVIDSQKRTIGTYADKEQMDKFSTDSPYNSLWIPGLALTANLAFTLPLLNKGFHIPTGMVALGKGLFGSYPQTINTVQTLWSQPNEGSVLRSNYPIPSLGLSNSSANWLQQPNSYGWLTLPPVPASLETTQPDEVLEPAAPEADAALEPQQADAPAQAAQ